MFATAGVAGGEISPNANGILPVKTTRKLAWGYAVGAGAEYAFRDAWGGAWTAKLEYLYADLGDNQFTDNFNEILHIRTQIQTVRAGLNFKF
jgi:outer membrane immunogenic protein